MTELMTPPFEKIRKTALFVGVFTFAYVVFGISTGWLGVAWLLPEPRNTFGARPWSPLLITLITAAPVCSVLVGMLWRRAALWDSIGATRGVHLLVGGLILAGVSYLPLALIGPILEDRPPGPGQWDMVVTLSHIWYVAGPAIATALAIPLIRFRAV